MIFEFNFGGKKGPVQTGSLGVMGLVVFGTAFFYHYDDYTMPFRELGVKYMSEESLFVFSLPHVLETSWIA